MARFNPAIQSLKLPIRGADRTSPAMCGLTGAAGAILVGIPPFWGLMTLTVLAVSLGSPRGSAAG